MAHLVKAKTRIGNQRLPFSLFFCFSKRKDWEKQTSPGGFRFPPGAPLNRPEKPLRFFWTFPAITRTALEFGSQQGQCESVLFSKF